MSTQYDLDFVAANGTNGQRRNVTGWAGLGEIVKDAILE